MKRPSIREVRRYLGERSNDPDPILNQKIEDMISRVGQKMQPRSVYRSFPLICSNHSFYIEDAVFQSTSLARNLKGCSEVVIMACTLGPEPDRLVKRAQISSLFETALVQASCTGWIESYCDEINQRIIEEAEARGLHCRPRYSPGYGDLPLEKQRDVFRLLNITREIGVSLTEGDLMVPTKSVTALIGLSETGHSCILEGCEACDRHDTCMYSRTEQQI